jgi:hypothetical protein
MELQAQKDVLPRADIELTHARLALKEKQLMELADAMRKMTPEERLIKVYMCWAAHPSVFREIVKVVMKTNQVFLQLFH